MDREGKDLLVSPLEELLHPPFRTRVMGVLKIVNDKVVRSVIVEAVVSFDPLARIGQIHVQLI